MYIKSPQCTKIRDVQITNNLLGVLGPFDHPMKLKAGMTQQLVFRDLDNFGNPETGPFYWPDAHKVRYKEIDIVNPNPNPKRGLELEIRAKNVT